jgi:hypothetical protein
MQVALPEQSFLSFAPWFAPSREGLEMNPDYAECSANLKNQAKDIVIHINANNTVNLVKAMMLSEGLSVDENRNMNGEMIESIQSAIAKTPEFDRRQLLLDEEPWDLSADVGDDLVASAPLMMYVGHGFWAMGFNVTTRLIRYPLDDMSAIPLPVLISNSPVICSVVNRGNPDLGDVVRLVSNRSEAQFSMVGSVGDFVSIADPSGLPHRWEYVNDDDSIENLVAFPAQYTFYAIAMAIEMGVAHGELDPMLKASDADLNQFIPTWRDKRKCMTVDKTMGRYAVWHDEVRCQVCNGRVLIKLPRGNTLDSCTCPHSLRREDIPNHEIKFPHLVDDRTFEEGGDSLENVPKEAQ